MTSRKHRFFPTSPANQLSHCSHNPSSFAPFQNVHHNPQTLCVSITSRAQKTAKISPLKMPSHRALSHWRGTVKLFISPWLFDSVFFSIVLETKKEFNQMTQTLFLIFTVSYMKLFLLHLNRALNFETWDSWLLDRLEDKSNDGTWGISILDPLVV